MEESIEAMIQKKKLREKKKNKKKDVLAAVPVNQAPPAECSKIREALHDSLLTAHQVALQQDRMKELDTIAMTGTCDLMENFPFMSMSDVEIMHLYHIWRISLGESIEDRIHAVRTNS